MKRVYVNEKWCLACHLCEYYCAFGNSGGSDMARSLMGVRIRPNIRVQEKDKVSFAVSCRHCEEPLCVKSCITGALTKKDGVVSIDHDRCIGCRTCVLVCPYGAVLPDGEGVMQKCELCVKSGGEPRCVAGCPNAAIVYEER